MGFVKFTETKKSFVARVSISSRGMISFNNGALRKFQIDGFKYCVLYYDKNANLIGVELTNDQATEGAIRIRNRKTGADLGAKSFVDYFEIAPKVTTMYPISGGDADNWINIDLEKGRERKINSEDD